MAKSITDNDLLEMMIEQSYDRDEDGNKFGDFGAYYRFDGLTVEDMLKAQRNAIKGGGGGGGGGSVSGSTYEDVTPDDSYHDWEDIVS